MSRYALWTEDENLEVSVGFEEGIGRYFLTIEDPRTSTGERGTYLFHNFDHHPDMSLTLEEVVVTLGKFGLKLPQDLFEALVGDARRCGGVIPTRQIPSTTEDTSTRSLAGPVVNSGVKPIRVLGWKSQN